MADTRDTQEIIDEIKGRLGSGWAVRTKHCAQEDWDDSTKRIDVLVNLCIDRFYLAYFRSVLNNAGDETVQLFLAER